jgi:hypothetical protein
MVAVDRRSGILDIQQFESGIAPTVYDVSGYCFNAYFLDMEAAQFSVKKKNKIKTASNVFRDVAQTQPRRSLLLKCHSVSCFVHKCNFSYTHKKSTAFPQPIFTQLKSLTALRTDLLHQISPKSKNKC